MVTAVVVTTVVITVTLTTVAFDTANCYTKNLLKMLLTLLFFSLVGGGLCTNCEGQLLKNKWSRWYDINGAPFHLTLPPREDSKHLLSGLQLGINTEEGEFRISIENSTTVSCEGWSTDITHENISRVVVERRGWWRRVRVEVKRGRVKVGGVRMCHALPHGHKTLAFRTTQADITVAVNCSHGCVLLDDETITALPFQPHNLPFHVKAKTMNASATIESCQSYHGRRRRLELSGRSMSGTWQRIRATTEKAENRYGPFKYHREKVTVLQVGNNTAIFIISRHIFEAECEKELSVAASSNMAWAVGCTESQLTYAPMEDASSQCDVWKNLVIATILIIIAFFLAVSITVAVQQRRELKRRMTDGKVVPVVSCSSEGPLPGRHQQTEQSHQNVQYHQQFPRLHQAADTRHFHSTDDVSGERDEPEYVEIIPSSLPAYHKARSPSLRSEEQKNTDSEDHQYDYVNVSFTKK